MRPALALLLLAAVSAPARAAGPTRYLELVNRAHDGMTALAVAPVGSGEFTAVPMRTLRGGGASATVAIAQPECRYDLRMEFGHGRTLLYRDIDVCRHARLRIAKLPRAETRASVVAAR